MASIGYRDEVIRGRCRYCHADRILHREGPPYEYEWACSCGTENYVFEPGGKPSVPSSVWIGHDRDNLQKIFAVPPGEAKDEAWARPYSVRSFIFQLSKDLAECDYRPEIRDAVFDEPVFADNCVKNDFIGPFTCEMAIGFQRVSQECPVWKRTQDLCQSGNEKSFLRAYLGLVRGREFPMLIPQPRLFPGDRYRPDFVIYVPLHLWNYEGHVVQLDRGHNDVGKDQDRDLYFESQGYRVLSLKGDDPKLQYYEDARRLIEFIDREMGRARTEPLAVVGEYVAIGQDPKEFMPF